MQAGRFEAISSSTYTVTIGLDEVTLQRRVAVGWYDDGSETLPMLFDSALANSETVDVMAFTELPLPTGAVGGAALGVSDGIFDGEEHPLVVGYAWNSNGDEEAVWWDWDSTQGEWVCDFLFGSSFSGNNSRAVDVELDPDSTSYERMHIFGQKEQTSGATPNVFKSEISRSGSQINRTANGTYDVGGGNFVNYSSAWAGDDNYPGGNVTVHNGDGVGTLTDATSGDDLAFIWRGLSVGGIDSLHPSGSQYLESGANDIANWDGTGTPPAVGWVLEDASPSDWKRPIYWRNGSQTVYFYLMPGFITDAEAIAVNGEDEILVRGDSGGIALWKWVTVSSNLEGDAFNLDEDRVQMTPSTLGSAIADATDINDEGWITATYIPDGETAQLPCILVPYDMDNDGEPDFREIMAASIAETTDLDVNDNWILDIAEAPGEVGTGENTESYGAMRVGLQAPGWDGRSTSDGTHMLEVENAHVIRLIFNLYESLLADPGLPASGWNLIPGLAELTGQEEWTSILTGDCGCASVHDRLTEWGLGEDGEVGGGDDKEIVLTVRSHFGDHPEVDLDRNSDMIPFDDEARELGLRSLRLFSHRFARCVDYLQLGNETYFGISQFRIFPQNDTGCTGLPQNGANISTLSGSCLEDSIALSLEWSDQQLEAGMIGSALAGRPLRFISAGWPDPAVAAAFGATPDSGGSDVEKFAYTLNELTTWSNDRNLFTDLHVHYETEARVAESLEKLRGTWTGGGSVTWEVPEKVVILEWGPKPSETDQNDGWWDINRDPNVRPLYLSRMCASVEECDGVPQDLTVTNWNELLTKWQDEQILLGEEWGIPGSLTDVLNHPVLLLCYGESYQFGTCTCDVEELRIWSMAALRAPEVDDVNGTDEWTAILDTYETEAASHSTTLLNAGFNPRATSCDVRIACPDCN